MRTLAYWQALGFDASRQERANMIRVRCSQCEMVAINGLATHEIGCPHQTHECKGCGTPIPKARHLCEDCWSEEA